jgi:DNA-binding MarR family transcriptional regulator
VETRDATALASRLRLALVRLNRKLRQQNGPELTASHVSALASIGRGGPMTVGELAELENVSSPAITKVAKALEELGLVTRRPGPADGRVTLLSLTAAGEKTLEQSRRRKDAWLARQLSELAVDDLAAIEAFIPIIERVTDDTGLPE